MISLTYLFPLILNQASAHCLWAAAKSSLQEHPNSIGVPDSWFVLSKLRWQIRQSFSALAECTLVCRSPLSKSTPEQQSNSETVLAWWSDTPDNLHSFECHDSSASEKQRLPSSLLMERRWPPSSISSRGWRWLAICKIAQKEKIHERKRGVWKRKKNQEK